MSAVATVETDELLDGRLPLEDTALLSLARSGNQQALEELWRRHYQHALQTAERMVGDSDASDVVSEAFTNTLSAMRTGGGPRDNFRAYLNKAVRHQAMRRWQQRDRMTTVDGVVDLCDRRMQMSAVNEVDNLYIGKAFESLPKRWQTVLWLMVVEGESPTSIAGRTGMKPNAVSALAIRAREGLRTAYLSEHVTHVAEDVDCKATVENLAAYTRGRPSRRVRHTVDRHLRKCARCSAAAREMEQVQNKFNGMFPIPVLVSGWLGTIFHGMTSSQILSVAVAGVVVGAGAPAALQEAGSAASGAANEVVASGSTSNTDAQINPLDPLAPTQQNADGTPVVNSPVFALGGNSAADPTSDYTVAEKPKTKTITKTYTVPAPPSGTGTSKGGTTTSTTTKPGTSGSTTPAKPAAPAFVPMGSLVVTATPDDGVWQVDVAQIPAGTTVTVISSRTGFGVSQDDPTSTFSTILGDPVKATVVYTVIAYDADGNAVAKAQTTAKQ